MAGFHGNSCKVWPQMSKFQPCVSRGAGAQGLGAAHKPLTPPHQQRVHHSLSPTNVPGDLPQRAPPQGHLQAPVGTTRRAQGVPGTARHIGLACSAVQPWRLCGDPPQPHPRHLGETCVPSTVPVKQHTQQDADNRHPDIILRPQRPTPPH